MPDTRLKRLKKFLKQILLRDIRYTLYKTPYPLEKLGTGYGGWIIPAGLLHAGSVCYLAGAGEDISFDTALAMRYHSRIFIFDPTPRSKAHFDRLMEAVHNGIPMPINQQAPREIYELDKEAAALLHFEEIGIWNRTATLKFFAPKDASHISHSIANLQDTGTYFEARVERLSEIMRSKAHDSLDLLKIDIEGAEFEVIDSILEDKPDIKILCVEFHTGKDRADGMNRIRETVKKLERNGYAVIARENFDFTFMKTNP